MCPSFRKDTVLFVRLLEWILCYVSVFLNGYCAICPSFRKDTVLCVRLLERLLCYMSVV